MQEQNEQKRAKLFERLDKKDMIWGGICAFLLLTLLALGIYLHKDITTSCRGESHTPYPWLDGNGLVVEEVQAHWQNSAKSGSYYLKTHVGYHPVVTVRLADACKGSGTLAIHLTDGDLQAHNKSTRLNYKNGEFVPVVRRNANDLMEASGKEATVLIPSGMGMDSRDGKDFMYHVSDRERKLWRIYVSNRPEGEFDYTDIGYTTIPATGKEL